MAWITIALLALLVGGWIAARLALPRVVRHQVQTVLRQAGFENASFKVDRVSLWETHISDLIAGSDRQLVVAAADVTYDPLDALSGELKSVRLRGARLVLPLDESAELPVKQNAAGEGSIPIERFELEDGMLILRRGERAIEMPVSGELSRNPSGAAQLAFQAKVDKSPLRIDGTVSATLREANLHVKAGGIALMSIAAALPEPYRQDLELSAGTLALEGAYQFSPSETSAKGQATLRDASIEIKGQYSGSFHNVDADLSADSVVPWMASRKQTVSIEQAEIVGQSFSKLSFEFTVGQPLQLAFSAAKVGWAGGTLSAEPFVLTPPSTDAEVQLQVQEIDLANLLEMLPGGVRGGGKISGYLGIRYADSKVRVNRGFLSSTGSGTIQLGQSVNWFNNILDQSDPRFTRDAQMMQVKQQIIDAMKDFQYDRLLINPSRENDELLLVVQIEGRGRTGARQPLVLTLNLRGFEHGLNTYLAAASRVLTIERN